MDIIEHVFIDNPYMKFGKQSTHRMDSLKHQQHPVNYSANSLKSGRQEQREWLTLLHALTKSYLN